MSTFGARTSRIARKPVSSGRRKSECHHQNTPDLLRPWPHPEIPHRALRALLFHARPRPAAPGEAHAPLLYPPGRPTRLLRHRRGRAERGPTTQTDHPRRTALGVANQTGRVGRGVLFSVPFPETKTLP